MPLRLTATTPGLVCVRGPTVQGVDWPAPGAATVVLPLLAYDNDIGPLTANGKAVPTDSAFDPIGPATSADAPAGPLFDDDAWQRALVWSPGPSATTQRWTLAAVAVIVLTLGLALHADPKRATLWTVVAAVGLSAGVYAAFPTDAVRRTVPVPGRPGWEWVFVASNGRTINEPWSAGLRFVPRTTEQLAVADPVLQCDSAGRPVAIRCRIDARRAVFLRRR